MRLRGRRRRGALRRPGAAGRAADVRDRDDAGDARTLDALFAQPPLFQWYSANAPGLRRGAAARDRAGLLPYLRSRVRVHDRLRLLAFRATGAGTVTFALRRSAADYRGGAPFELVGKDAAVCPGPQLIVLSLGAPGSRP